MQTPPSLITPPLLSTEMILEKLKDPPTAGARSGYLAMYSSWLGGITVNPSLMFVPVDDHIVHRGDGVFEAAKCIAGRIYALDPHLERLSRSAERIGLPLPHPKEDIRRIVIETLRVAFASIPEGQSRDLMMRLYISRGPGGFTANPYESVGSQMYLVMTSYKAVPAEKYESGASVIPSQYPVKEGFFPQVKSCNYLPNVLMKKESVDAGVDFTVACEADGTIAESSTENFAIISAEGDFLIPSFERTLRGITAVRVMTLAGSLVKAGKLRRIAQSRFTILDVARAREAVMMGTTLDVLPVTQFDRQPVGDGRVGPVARELLRLLRADMAAGDW